MKSFSLREISMMCIFVCTLLLLPAGGVFGSDSQAVPKVPVPGMITMVDIGAKACIPCKMMAPIMEELEKEYKDKAAILFIDVWENPGAGDAYGIKLIPTQIFYNAEGEEVLRHEGFMAKADIVAELEKLGVK